MSLPVSLTEYALDIIREKILTGEYPPGSKLQTETISKELGVSRTPVIAAINRLVVEELAITVPRHGTLVRKFTKDEVKDILEARYMIELFAAPLVVNCLDRNQRKLARLETLLSEFENIADMSYSEANQLDSEFHTLYIEMSGNSQLVKLHRLNWSVGITYHMFYLAKLPLETQISDYKDHRRLVDAIKAKDTAALIEVITKNKESNMRLVDQHLDSNG